MFVIPMVGRSSRFFSAGYTRPKYELELRGESLFAHAVRSFERYFADSPFVFMVREDHDARGFVEGELARIGVRDTRIVSFDRDTAGQADTVHRGLAGVDGETPIYIFNIDTFRPGFTMPALAETCDGYLEVFRGEGEHWSFVEPAAGGAVRRTTEKQRISDLCSDGLYYFRRKGDFDHAFEAAVAVNDRAAGEYYVAPLYNWLIGRGADIRYDLVDRSTIHFCGTPEEYEGLRSVG